MENCQQKDATEETIQAATNDDAIPLLDELDELFDDELEALIDGILTQEGEDA